MKKSMKKIISFALMLSLLVGMMTGISVSAAEEPTVEIVSNNVYHKEVMSLMYAVRATEGYDVAVKIYDEENTLVETITDYSVGKVKGEDAMIFTSKVGVPAQDIDTEFYAVAELSKNGEVVKSSAMERYSVLEYLYERLTVSEDVSDAQRLMYNNLLAFADSADIVINNDTTTNIAKYSYVRVENGTVDGTYATAMLMEGTLLDELVTGYTVESGKVLAWDIEVCELDGTSTETIQKDEDLKAGEYTIGASKAYMLAPNSMDSGAPTIVSLATFKMGTQTTDNTNGINEFKDTDGSYTLTVTSAGGKMYKSVVNGDSALKFGASGVKGDGAIKLSANVTKVVLYVCKYSTDSTKLLVNGTEYTLTSDVQAIEIEQPTANTEWTVSFEAKTASKNRFYITTVEFIGYEVE